MTFKVREKTCGIDIRSNQADDGRFAEKRFTDAVKDCNQTIDFCAVGGHH